MLANYSFAALKVDFFAALVKKPMLFAIKKSLHRFSWNRKNVPARSHFIKRHHNLQHFTEQ